MTPSFQQKDIKDLTKRQLAQWLEDQGVRAFRATQIFKWIYLRQADNFDAMTDLGKSFRDLLAAHFTINRLAPVTIDISGDGTRKYLFQLADGQYIESVLIPEKNHHTLCVSTQVGCAQGCKFCLTAKGGFKRNLSTGEILAQIRDVKKDLLQPQNLKNIVFMGMGEPLANYNNLLNAIETITDSDNGLKFSTRRVTVSTAGLIPKILELGVATHINLAISLNATDNKTRSLLMPINRTYPMEDLIEACKHYPLLPRRKITFEYVLIKGINDSAEDAGRLVKLLAHVRAKINVIPFNPYPGTDMKRPSDKVISHFLGILLDGGFTAIIRHSKGQDISAACGQLSAHAGQV